MVLNRATHHIMVSRLTHFWPMFSFYILLKTPENRGFLVFLGVWNGNIVRKWVNEICWSIRSSDLAPERYSRDYLATASTFFNPWFPSQSRFQPRKNKILTLKRAVMEIRINPAKIYLLKVNSINTRKRYEICSKLTIKTPGWGQWRCSGVFFVNFELISHLFLVFLLLTLNK